MDILKYQVGYSITCDVVVNNTEKSLLMGVS